MKNKIIRYLAGFSFVAAAILSVGTPTFAANTLNRQLQQGMTGTDVSSLQSYLAQDPTIYPQGLVTGYYGALTTSAVMKFQARYGIPMVGRCGPVTLAALNSRMSGGTTISGAAPDIMGISTNTTRTGVNVYFTTDQLSKAVVYYSSSPLVTYERENSVDVSGLVAMTDSAFHTSQNVSITGLTPNTVYYYMIYATNQNGYVSVSVPTGHFQTMN